MSPKPFEATIVIPILQMRDLRLREGKGLAMDEVAGPAAEPRFADPQIHANLLPCTGREVGRNEDMGWSGWAQLPVDLVSAEIIKQVLAAFYFPGTGVLDYFD